MEKWVGKVAVVTGASSGIGAAITKELASKGMIVVGLAPDPEKIEENAKKDPNLKIFAFNCDVSDLSSVKKAFKKIEEKFSSISVLINNAGIGASAKILDESDEAGRKIDEVINVNFKGVVNCAREAVKLIKKSNDFGLIVNTASIIDSFLPFGVAESIYPTTKHAVRAFSEVLRQELIAAGNDKIRVANLSPGTVKTEIFGAGTEQKDDLPGSFKGFNYLFPQNIAEGVVYLLSTPTSVNVTQLTIRPIMEKF